jgi:hypothetical protein
VDAGDQSPPRISPQKGGCFSRPCFLSPFYATACAQFQPGRASRLSTQGLALWIVSLINCVNCVDKPAAAARLAGHTRFAQVNPRLS